MDGTRVTRSIISRSWSSARSASISSAASSGSSISTWTRAWSPRSGMSMPLMLPRWPRITRVIACSVPGRSEHSSSIANVRFSSGKRALATRRHAAGVEAEPVHPPEVPGMLDLDAAIDDRLQPTVLGDLRALRAADAELEPEGLRADGDRVAGDVRPRGGLGEHVDHVHRERNVLQALERRLAEDLLLLRVHRHDLVAVPLQVEADEVGRPQRIGREADDRDRARAEERRVDDARVLVALAHAFAAASPRARSRVRSESVSSPTESRIVPGPTPAAASSSSLSWRWVVLAGWMTRLFASPTFARCDQSSSAEMNRCPASRPPTRSKTKIEPAPFGRYRFTSDAYGLEASPG